MVRMGFQSGRLCWRLQSAVGDSDGASETEEAASADVFGSDRGSPPRATFRYVE